MRKLTLCVLILLCPFHWGIAQGNLKKAASAAAKRLEPKVKTLPRLQAAQPGSQTAKSGAVNKWKMQTGRPLAVHPGVPPGANSLKEYTLDFDALFPAQYMDALQEPTLFDKGFSSSETSSLEERLLQARNNRLHALEKWLWRSRLDYFEKHMLQIAETMLTFTLDGPVNYLRYIPSDTRMLFLGEIHYSANIKKEINSLLFQIRAARPKQKIFLFSEFLSQGYQLPPGQDLPDFLKKEYGFEVYQVAHDLNIHLVGLEDASLVASLSKQEFSDDYAGYVDGTVRRNEAWVRPLRQFMEREPEALFIVYAGFSLAQSTTGKGKAISGIVILLALAFFCVSALLFSQGATSALLVPVAASLGCDAPMILACFVAVSGIFVTNVYPTSAFAVSCDDTGSYMGKWSGSFVINHPFFLPGCLGLVAAIPFGFLLASIVF